MDKVLLRINSISHWSGKIVSYLIVPMIVIVVYTAFMRYVVHQVPRWGFEMSLFVYGMHFILGGAYCLATDSHVSVDVLPRYLPIRGQKIIRIISNLVILFVCLYMVLQGSKWAWQSTKILEHSIHQTAFNPPIWWFKWMVPISAGLIALQSFSGLVSTIQSLLNCRKEK